MRFIPRLEQMPRIVQLLQHHIYQKTVVACLISFGACFFVFGLTLVVLILIDLMTVKDEPLNVAWYTTVYSGLGFVISYLLLHPAIILERRRIIQPRNNGVNWGRDGF